MLGGRGHSCSQVCHTGHLPCCTTMPRWQRCKLGPCIFRQTRSADHNSVEGKASLLATQLNLYCGLACCCWAALPVLVGVLLQPATSSIHATCVRNHVGQRALRPESSAKVRQGLSGQQQPQKCSSAGAPVCKLARNAAQEAACAQGSSKQPCENEQDAGHLASSPATVLSSCCSSSGLQPAGACSS